MTAWLSMLGLIAAACSAVALYAGSPHCMWAGLRGFPRATRVAGTVLALLSLATWIAAQGGAIGLCAMLASWMLALVVQPYIALRAGTPSVDVTARENE